MQPKDKKVQLVEHEFEALGTEISVQIVVANEAQRAKAEQDVQSLPRLYREQEQIFSRFNQASELSQINQQVECCCEEECTCPGCQCLVSEDLKAVAELSLQYYNESEGLFDPRIIGSLENAGYATDFKSTSFQRANTTLPAQSPHGNLKEQLSVCGNNVLAKARLDFAGIAKGYITDKAARYLQAQGWKNFLMDSGGDMYLSGTNRHGQPWGISLEGAQEQQLMLQLADCAIATSGISRRKWEINGQRFHHLINPQQPDQFDFSLRSVTVVGASVVEADVWAKVLFLKGREAGLRLSNKRGLKSIFLEYNGGTYISDAIKPLIYNS